MNILIVGAGAVGLVYGHHFSRAGHQVTFLVKEKYQEKLNRERNKDQPGVVLYHLNKDKKFSKPQYFNHFKTITDWSQAQCFDLIALAISSNALRQLPRDHINQVLQNNNSDLLMLQPSMTDFEYLNKVIPTKKIFQGMINLISYQTDEVNHHIKPSGIAYYLPPMPMPISVSIVDKNSTNNTQQRLKIIVSLFKSAGVSAKKVDSAIDNSRLPSAFLMTFLCVLEAANWEFEQLRKTPNLLQKLSTAQQDLLPQQIIGNGLMDKFKRSLASVLVKLLLKPPLYKLLLKTAPWLVPLPLEAYLKKHFLKVRSQTVMYMQEYQEAHPTKAIKDLNKLLFNKR